MKLSVSLVSRTIIAPFGAALGATAALATDIDEIKARGELRHIGIKYANLVTGDGNGSDVELMQGFARHLGVKFTRLLGFLYGCPRPPRQGRGPEWFRGNPDPVLGDVISNSFGARKQAARTGIWSTDTAQESTSIFQNLS